MNVNKVLTKDYDKRTLGGVGKTNPIQTQFKPKQTQLKPIKCQNKPNSNPNKPNSPSDFPTDLLRQWQELKFGMFIHYGLSTFTGDWRTNKNASPAAYAPSNLDVRQWIRTAKKTGMKYAVLTAKHTLGHCLWDSNDYTYDVAAGTEKTDVIDAFIRNCRAEGIKPGLYYCVLDIYNEGGSTLLTSSNSGSTSPISFLPPSAGNSIVL
ncbi:MAG: alpha-L-fucosidase [Planctomycetota bacterium]